MSSKRDYYEILGVDKNATDDQIKSAFRKSAMKYHPDRQQGKSDSEKKEAEEKFKECQEAYSVLSDKQKRQQYDQFGHAAFEQGGMGGGFQGGFQDFDFSDIFGDIFGGGFSSFGGGRSRGPRPERGDDLLKGISLNFFEAAFGCEKDVKVECNETCKECSGKGGFDEETCSTCHGSGTITQEQRTMFGSFLSKTTCHNCNGTGRSFKKKCTKCHGTGQVRQNKTITIKVPSGIDDGMRLRLSGKGGAGLNGGENGDLYVEFSVSTHQFFERDKNDIYLEVPLTITEAILGTKKEIPTLNSTITLTVPAGTNTGDKQRVRGKGIENSMDKETGDMYIIYKVLTPSKLSREQKDLIEKLSKTNLSSQEIEKFDNFVKTK